LRRKNVYSVDAADCDRSGLPVCLANASKSFTDPGSVATMRSTCPLAMSLSAFLARRMGSGQLSPRASSSLSKSMLLSPWRMRRRGGRPGDY
jgi:hypothetical protein